MLQVNRTHTRRPTPDRLTYLWNRWTVVQRIREAVLALVAIHIRARIRIVASGDGSMVPPAVHIQAVAWFLEHPLGSQGQTCLRVAPLEATALEQPAFQAAPLAGLEQPASQLPKQPASL